MQTQEPKLAAPGAGLPFPQNLFVRYFLGPFQSRKNTWEENLERFNREGERILKLTEGMSEAELTKRILVANIRGLEDSSRYWSAAMTMEHLMIVGRSMALIIEKLGRGENPQLQVSVAAVKPSVQEFGLQTRAQFAEFQRTHGRMVLDSVLDRESPFRQEHPWFGAITAGQWFWLMGVHNGIHRRQIEKIRQGLDKEWAREDDVP
jgi:hypothetical protein